MKEGLFSIDKSCVFRETFNSQQDTEKNGGTVTDVSYSEGIGSFNGTSSDIKYSGKRLKEEISFRIILSNITFGYHAVFSMGVDGGSTNDGIIVFFDTRVGQKLLQFKVFGANYNSLAGTLNPKLNTKHEVIISISKKDNYIKYYFNSNLIYNRTYSFSFDDVINDRTDIGAYKYGGNTYSNVKYDLLEIYNKALSQEEVTNLYNKTTYRDIRDGLILDIDARGGVIEDRMGNALTLDGVEVKKDTVNSCYFPSSYSKIHSNVIINDKDITVNLWLKLSPSAVGAYLDFFGTDTTHMVGKHFSPLLFLVINPNMAMPSLTKLVYSKWRMFTYVIKSDGTELLYNDGINFYNSNNGNSFSVGVGFTFGKVRFIFYGCQNQMRIYNRALSSEEISRLYTSQRRNYE